MLASPPMFFRDHWRIETTVGWIELELDEEGEPLTDEEEIWETDCILFRLKYAVKNRDPRVTKAIIEVYSEFHPERFPPGIVPTSISPHAIDDLRPEMIDFLEDEVETGRIRLYDDDVVMTKVDRTEKIKHTPQPIVLCAVYLSWMNFLQSGRCQLHAALALQVR